jgi:hypothetical protein
MAATYILEVKNSPEQSATHIIVDVSIFRDGIKVMSWVARFPMEMADSDISKEIERRVKEFVKVDLGNILKTDLEARSSAIADSLNGLKVG